MYLAKTERDCHHQQFVQIVGTMFRNYHMIGLDIVSESMVSLLNLTKFQMLKEVYLSTDLKILESHIQSAIA